MHQTRRRLRDKKPLVLSLRDQGGLLVLPDLTLGICLALKGSTDLARFPAAYHWAEHHEVLVVLSFLRILVYQLE